MSLCPLCNELLACGWWCLKCKLDKTKAEKLAVFKQHMAAGPDWAAIVFFVAIVVGLPVAFLILGWFGIGQGVK